MNEYEESFIKISRQQEKNAKSKICIEEANYCSDFMEETEDEDDSVNDEFESDKTEL